MKKIILLIFSAFNFFYSHSQMPNESNITIVIHGGAGNINQNDLGPEREREYRTALTEALDSGYNILQAGGTSKEAVVAAIKILEDSPLFNAGRGAVFTNRATNELDASIMDGKTKNAGAVAAVTNIKNPIEAALEVMDHSPHVLMAGKGAEDFAAERGLEIVHPSYFKTQHRLNQLEIIKDREEKNKGEKGYFSPHDISNNDNLKFGTVGAVALDQYGNIVAGTSTGGMSNKKYGRIGDSPIIGAGTYADNETCGVSGTGHGEYFMRYLVAYDIVALLKYKNMNLVDATHKVIMENLKNAGGDGGLIALDKDGNIAMPFNTTGMFRGYRKFNQQPQVFLYKEE